MSTAKKNVNKKVRPQNKHLKPIQKGEVRNPKGRPKGALDRKTVLRRALERIALSQDKTPEEIELLLQEAGFKHALKGQFNFYKEISDGLYGPLNKERAVTVNVNTEASKEVTELTKKLNDIYKKK